jgi:hypothetical protein
MTKGTVVPICMEETADLHLGQQGGIDPDQLDRRGSAGTTQSKEGGCVRQHIWLTPRELDTGETQSNGNRLGLRGTLGE